MKKVSKLIVGFLFLQINLPQVFGWGPVSHYSISKDASVLTVGELPDAWPPVSATLAPTEWFCWSHAVQTTGRTWGVPNEPYYPNDRREPGENMYYLVKNKIKNPTTLAKKTAQAFMGHNAADRVVHYSYFLGGFASPPSKPGDNWLVHHRDKEEWADYWIYLWRQGGGFDPKTGKPTKIITITCLGDTKIIQLSQRVFIKNRRGIEKGKNGIEAGLGKTDTLAEIEKRIRDYMNTSQKKMKKMNYKAFRKRMTEATKYGWTLDELRAKYWQSVNAVKSAYTSHP